MTITQLREGSITFAASDFDVFTIPGLEPRMEALIASVRPKLTALGHALIPELAAYTGTEMFPHVAKHARRTVHAPNDTWVAWSSNKKGYKMLPHYQVGLFSTHLFAYFAIIYESDNKKVFARALNERLGQIRSAVPDHFRWSMDHMRPESTAQRDMSDEAFTSMAGKLAGTKKSEVMVGIHIERGDPILMDADALYERIRNTFEALSP